MQVAFHILNAFEVDGQPVERWPDVNLFEFMTRGGPAYRTMAMAARSGWDEKYVQRGSTSCARPHAWSPLGRPGSPR